MRRSFLLPLVLMTLALVTALSAITAACGGGETTTTTGAASVPATGVSTTIVAAAPTTTTPTAPETTGTTEAPMPEGVAYKNILLMGTPERNVDPGPGSWAITHVLITLDPSDRVVKFTQFPYNMLVDIETDTDVRTEQLQFVSGEYGEEKVVETLKNAFGIQIDDWATLNLPCLAATVDQMGGVEVDIQSLTINEVAADILGFLIDQTEWDEITDTGPQTLNGVQSVAYIEDTRPQGADPITEEEMLFRDRHENLLRAILSTVKLLDMEANDVIALAQAVAGDYFLSVPDTEWPALAETLLYCLKNDPQFLFIPAEIVTVKDDMFTSMVFDKDVDVKAVQEFVGGP